jgi:hypothetical protein
MSAAVAESERPSQEAAVAGGRHRKRAVAETAAVT